MKRGKLIVFEGVSGTGKETQAKLLQQFLRKKGITSRIVFHPSPELKKILSSWRIDRDITPLIEVYLLLADRSSRVHQIIRPALANGEWVISLRNSISALVYQGKTEKERIWIAKEFARFEPTPDYLFYFDIAPSSAMDRVMARHGKTGEPIGKFETPQRMVENRRAYKQVLKNIHHVFIDASRSIDEIHQKVMKYIL